MELMRCPWVDPNNELDKNYHDTEWGREVHDDRLLFEMLILEGAQAGLSWKTILKRRENYKKAFDNFDVQIIGTYDETKIKLLLQNPGIIRNKLKIHSVIQNAQVFINIQKEWNSFDAYIWNFIGNKPIKNCFETLEDYPAYTELSTKISTDLKKRGMNFVGKTIIYSFMQAIGMSVDHSIHCFCYKK